MREKEAEHERGRGREREIQNPRQAPSRLWAVSTEPDGGLKLTNHEIMIWGEVRRLNNWAIQVPLTYFWKVYLFILRVRLRVWEGEGQREREKESQAGSAVSLQSPTWGSNPQTMRAWPQLKSRVRCLPDWATQAPLAYAVLLPLPHHLVRNLALPSLYLLFLPFKLW